MNFNDELLIERKIFPLQNNNLYSRLQNEKSGCQRFENSFQVLTGGLQ